MAEPGRIRARPRGPASEVSRRHFVTVGSCVELPCLYKTKPPTVEFFFSLYARVSSFTHLLPSHPRGTLEAGWCRDFLSCAILKMLIKPRDPHPLGRPADPCGGLSSYPDLPVRFRRIVTTLEVQRRGNVGPSRAFPAARACMGWADEIERASRCSLTGLWVWAGRKERRCLIPPK